MRKNYRKELDDIVPDKKVVDGLFNKIVERKHSRGLKVSLGYLIPVFGVVLLLIPFVLSKDMEAGKGPVPLRRTLPFVYDNNDYCEVGRFYETSDLIKKETLSNGIIVYKIRNNKNIVIYTNNVYNEYEICR